MKIIKIISEHKRVRQYPPVEAIIETDGRKLTKHLDIKITPLNKYA